MPSNIPYDPALALGNLVSKERLDMLEQIASTQAPADAAENTLNSLIAVKHALDMTSQELAMMGIDTTELDAERAQLDRSISEAAESYAKAKIKAVKDTQSLHATVPSISDSTESPIDHNRSHIKQEPLSADGLRMHAQYFSFDSSNLDAGTHASNVAKFISKHVSHLGSALAVQALRSSASQVHSQIRDHSIAGTLVIAVTCVHKDAVFLAPLILDADKGIQAFNACFPDETIKTGSLSAMQDIAARPDTTGDKALTVISGATLGSCFIGMAHISSTTQINTAMEGVASSLQTQFTIGNWFGSVNGVSGMGNSFGDDAKLLLSSQNIVSQCTLTTIGSSSSATLNQFNIGALELSGYDASESMKASPQVQGVQQNLQDPIALAQPTEHSGQSFVATKSDQMESMLSDLKESDDGEEKIVDINALVAALDDYVEKCVAGRIGLPITYYTKRVTASQLAQSWIEKYCPASNRPSP
ncbi:hypothetical protein VC279_02595 [Xanthomonas sp. WHRI 10064A]|uniref:hypothetical protein n=1 Tax=unclassified Xanthomonas TaxID=2643310 RepID=UPI002B23525E|nr:MULTISPECIES: hypothetical protein [unclassified Xanthomonas]MEA9588671.1 hypothetical protein [Xanthomonas sp. WHRI 10064B]MEA9613656.1 hypothetical protein [Xanthomonas sp. WHRI 10064A]